MPGAEHRAGNRRGRTSAPASLHPPAPGLTQGCPSASSSRKPSEAQGIPPFTLPLFETMVQGCNFSCFCVIHLTARFFQEMMKSASIWGWGKGAEAPHPLHHRHPSSAEMHSVLCTDSHAQQRAAWQTVAKGKRDSKMKIRQGSIKGENHSKKLRDVSFTTINPSRSHESQASCTEQCSSPYQSDLKLLSISK